MTTHKTPGESTDSPARAPDQRGGKGKQVRRTTPPSESVVASWYKNAKGRVSQNWPFPLVDYWNATLKPNPNDFELRKAGYPQISFA